ncbi:MAG: GNAT family N-acetyltransferase [Betaproteobacteria bacterium]|nr:GNAT family N-acetyltransferase [Betaproteobacteria bacterium]
MQIRAAQPADIPALSALLSLLFAQEAEFTPDPAAQAEGLRRIIGDPQLGLIITGRIGNEVVAMVNLLFTVSTALGGRVALLEDLVVAPAHRGAGLGGRLLEHALAEARAAGCKRVTLLTDRDNAGARRFYARHGFLESSMLTLRRQW